MTDTRILPASAVEDITPARPGSPVTSGTEDITGGYELLEIFHDDRSAGNIDGTYPLIGPVRNGTDTANYMGISGGELAYYGSVGWEDPLYFQGSFPRTAGMLLYTSARTDVNQHLAVGWSNPNGGHSYAYGSYNLNGGTSYAGVDGSWSNHPIGTYTTDNVPNEFVIIVRPVGLYYLHKISGVWSLEYIDHTRNDPTLEVFTKSLSASARVQSFVIPQARWVPPKRIADTFGNNQITITDSGPYGLHTYALNVMPDDGEMSGTGTSVIPLPVGTGANSIETTGVFDGDEGTIIAGCGPAIMNDIDQYIVNLNGNYQNYLFLRIPQNTTNYQNFYKTQNAAGAANAADGSAVTTSVMTTWSVSATKNLLYFDGVEVDDNVAHTFPGWDPAFPLDPDLSCIYTYRVSSVSVGPWLQTLNNVIIANTAISAANAATIDGHIAAGTLTRAILDGILDKYVWYKLDEFANTDTYLSDGGSGTGIETGGSGLSWTGNRWYNLSDGSGVTNAPALTGSELITNGGFDTDTNWTKGAGWTISGGVASINGTGSTSIYQSPTIALDIGTWHAAQFSISNYVSGTVGARFGTYIPAYVSGNGAHYLTGLVTANDAASPGLRDSGTAVFSVDNLSYKHLTLADLFYSYGTADPHAYIEAAWTADAATQCGVFACLDSATTPANYINAWINKRATVTVTKTVAGVTTVLSDNSITYSDDALVTIRTLPSGNDVEVYVFYGGTKVANHTITDAHLPLAEDVSGNGLDGVYNSVALDGTGATFDGTSSYVDMINSAFTNWFDGTAGTVIADVNSHTNNGGYLCYFGVDAGDRVGIYTLGSNLTALYRAGGTQKTSTIATWAAGRHTVGFTFGDSANGDSVDPYYDGSPAGSSVTGVGAFSGTIGTATVFSQGQGTYYDGDGYGFVLAKSIATSTEMATIHGHMVAGTLTKAILDGIFGALNYIYIPMTETGPNTLHGLFSTGGNTCSEATIYDSTGHTTLARWEPTSNVGDWVGLTTTPDLTLTTEMNGTFAPYILVNDSTKSARWYIEGYPVQYTTTPSWTLDGTGHTVKIWFDDVTVVTRFVSDSDKVSSLSSLNFSGYTSLTHLYINNNTPAASYTLATLVMPDSLEFFRADNTTWDADFSNWTISPALTRFWAYSMTGGDKGVPDLSGAVSLNDVNLRYDGMSQTNVDAWIDEIYTNRAIFTDASPLLYLDNVNAAPSGIYQYAATPSTGLEKIYALENDDDAEGYNTWTITYTAP